jgi:L-threonylcarbamoyladenylate synthase
VITSDLLTRAGEIIRRGGLVAFPTETVYGLGANALDEQAVKRIFEVKGRPPASPLIVHVESVAAARGLAADWPEAAQRLAEAFWPGPLTLVLPKVARIPGVVTAGLATVGLRQPDHPIADALIREAGVPIAAPSANRFTGLSPTTAEHVLKSLGNEIDLILDGGPTRIGIESAVVAILGARPRLLRPGILSREQLEEVVGEIDAGLVDVEDGHHPSPGLHDKHYSPLTPLFLVEGDRLPNRGRGAYLWLTQPLGATHTEQMPAAAAEYAAALYETLHRIDERGFDWIAVETPPSWPEWAGILDRLRRASHRL